MSYSYLQHKQNKHYNKPTSTFKFIILSGAVLSWLWSYGSWIYNYLCNQYLSQPTLRVWIPLRRGVLDTTLCDQVCQGLAADQWCSTGTPISSTNKTDSHDIIEILLNTITLALLFCLANNLVRDLWINTVLTLQFSSIVAKKLTWESKKYNMKLPSTDITFN